MALADLAQALIAHITHDSAACPTAPSFLPANNVSVYSDSSPTPRANCIVKATVPSDSSVVVPLTITLYDHHATPADIRDRRHPINACLHLPAPPKISLEGFKLRWFQPHSQRGTLMWDSLDADPSHDASRDYEHGGSEQDTPEGSREPIAGGVVNGLWADNEGFLLVPDGHRGNLVALKGRMGPQAVVVGEGSSDCWMPNGTVLGWDKKGSSVAFGNWSLELGVGDGCRGGDDKDGAA